MTRSLNWLCAILSLLTLLRCAPRPDVAETPRRPNVIFVLADDLGIMDINAYATQFTGTPAEEMYYETPNLDRLIGESVAFSQAYATQLCSPSRAGLLAGKFAPRLGFMTAMPLRETYYNQALPVPQGYSPHDVLDHHDDIHIERVWNNATSNSALAPETVTLPEAMTDHHAAFLGKWHLGGFGAEGVQPADQGFEELAYYDGGGSPYYDWRAAWDNKSTAHFPKMPQKEWAIGKAGEPTREAYLTDDLTARALDFLDRQAESDTLPPFFLYFNHFAVHSPYQGVEAEVAYYAKKRTRGWNGHKDPVYASMVAGLDRSVGALMDKLEATGLADSTIVVLMSDNGGIDHKITPDGSGTDNEPFLGGKACLTEGGIRVPLFIWKKGQQGRWETTPVDYTDLYPTLLEATGYDAQARVGAEDLDGRSLWSFVDPRSGSYRKDTRYWHYPFNVIYHSPYDGHALTPHSAIRSGKYKLIFDWYGRRYLYDLEADPYEKNDLAESETRTRDRLFGELMEWLKQEVAPRYWPQRNPDYDLTNEIRRDRFEDLIATGSR